MITTAGQLTTADYIGSVPALLGIFPDETVTLIFVRRGRIAMVVDAALDQDRAGFAAHIAAVAAERHLEAVQIVVVARTNRASEALTFADLITAQLDTHAITLIGRAYTHQLQRGASWTDLDTYHVGTIPDPATTAVAVAAITEGRVLLAARHDLIARYTLAATPDPETRRVARADSARPSFAATTLRELARIVATGAHPSAELAARLEIMVTISHPARTAMLGVAAIDPRAAAEVLTEAANQMRDIPRAHLLAAVALLHYITGYGVASYEAVTHAREAARTARTEIRSLIEFVAVAHERIIPIEFVRPMLTQGRHAALKFGIEVPDFS
ncbi:hypothetical protein ABH933_001228 [Nocardia sp. GP40]|uniref:DUF4192 family protein n=1 Tax=Nocardia sp. GP40 TaxID=3156268 RepID=UPI003D23E00F